MAPTDDRQNPIAVWYFIAATFILTLPNLLFPDVNVALRVATVVTGMAVMALGFAHLRRELTAEDQPPRDDGSSST